MTKERKSEVAGKRVAPKRAVAVRPKRTGKETKRASSLPAPAELGWTREQMFDTYCRLKAFEEDWNAPGMEVYDELAAEFLAKKRRRKHA